jgi:arsenate reductase
MKKNVLFICTHNSARSQMAEGFVNALYGDQYEAFSAGIESGEVNPYVITAMAEIGIDISRHRSKSLDEFYGKQFDVVVTVCDHAKEACPFFPGETVLHKNFQDPSRLKGSDNVILQEVRRIRDDIKEWVLNTFKRALQTEPLA